MGVHRTVTAIATAPIRFGSFVAVDGERCSPDPERAGIGGIAKRPHQAGASESYQPGETVMSSLMAAFSPTSPRGSAGSE